MLFQDRREAGQVLAQALEKFRGQPNVVVLALPRGGVPVAYEVARELNLPLDVFIVRKLGVPGQEELAMGAIASGGAVVLNQSIVDEIGISPEEIEAVAKQEKIEMERRESEYRDGLPSLNVEGCTTILIDDGLATGASMRAAARALRPRARRVIVAVPVASESTCQEFRSEVDQIVCAITPQPFYAVGMFYRNFEQTTDEEVRMLLARSRRDSGRTINEYSEFRYGQDVNVRISAGPAKLEGDLNIPSKAKGVVIFAHGSGSSRHSPRNRYVANVLQDAGFATLLLDLLTSEEESVDLQTAELRFDISLLVSRLLYAAEWTKRQSQLSSLRFGYFGASTGAAAALVAASRQSNKVAAVVSRGGRPDLAGPALASLQAPTLLIIGGEDYAVLELNRRAAAQLRCEKRIEIVSGATHLFEEPGALDEVARLAREWFELHLGYRQDEIQVA